MKNTLILIASSLAIASANVVVFVNPSTAIYPPATPAVLGPLVAPPLVSSVVDDLGNFAATLTTTVHSGGSNPLGGLTFVYTLSNDILPPTVGDDIYAFGVIWDPAYVPAMVDVDTAPGPGVVPFSFNYGSRGIAFSFNFASLPLGASSVAIAVGTAAPSWVLGDAGIINLTTEDALALVPVPEPAIGAGLLALGLFGFGIWRRLRA